VNCVEFPDLAGSYLDGELPPDRARALEAHASTCPACARELDRLRHLIARLGGEAPCAAATPAALWSAIERRLNKPLPPASVIRATPARRWRRPLALAASLALMFGAASSVIVWTHVAAPQAHATTIDYGLLLDGLSEDLDAALERFLDHYQATPLAAMLAPDAAPHLRFRVPEQLPGGYRLKDVWRLKLEGAAGVAARYVRDDEPLVVFFHAPADQTRTGVHAESHCQVAGRDGQCVTVGPWHLLHFTDPTTCHCLLSRIEDPELQREIFAAIAPDFQRYATDLR